MSVLSYRLLLLFILPLPGRSEEDCSAHNWGRALGHQQKDDFIIYGITQDCQIFFARSSQVGSLDQIKPDPNSNYCYPNLIQLQIIDNSTLRLIIKQHGNRICVLAINIPPLNILIGPNAFTYSLSSSMPYARCSHAASSLSLQTDLAFPDSAYRDILYFVDPTSSGTQWTARQFMLNENNTLSYLDKFSIRNGDTTESGSSLANDFVLSMDAERNFLFKRNRFARNFTYECAFDLLFRPNSVVFGSSYSYIVNAPNERSSWLNSLSINKEVMIFAETDKQSPVAPTRLYVQSTQGRNTRAYCIGRLPYRVELGLLSIRTVEQLSHKPLPMFEVARNAPPRAFRPRHHGGEHAPPPPALVSPPLQPDDGQKEVTRHVQSAHTSSRLTKMTITTTTQRPTITKDLPSEHPDESEDLTDDDAALYDTQPDDKPMTHEDSANITGFPSSTTISPTAAATSSPLASGAPQPFPSESPKNATLFAKSSLSLCSLISAILVLLSLST